MFSRKLRLSLLWSCSFFFQFVRSDFVDSSGNFVISSWLEVGSVTVKGDSFTSVTGKVKTFMHPHVFMSVPDNGNSRLYSGFASATRLRGITNTTINPGAVSFEVRYVQPNDSWCNYSWWTPIVEPAQSLQFMIMERGHFNLSGAEFDVKSGNYGMHCKGQSYRHFFWSNFRTGTRPVWLAHYQTYEDPRYITFRGLYDTNTAKAVTLYIQLHNVNIKYHPRLGDCVVGHYADHYDNNRWRQGYTIEPESVAVLGYVPEYGVSCKEGIAFEAHTTFGITSDPRWIAYYWSYYKIPAVFGVINSNVGGDDISVRSFNHSLLGIGVMAQETQCSKQINIHIQSETMSFFVIGPNQLGLKSTASPYSTFHVVSGTCEACYVDSGGSDCYGILRRADPPTGAPTAIPSASPTAAPTFEPTAAPTFEPTAEPTSESTATPTFEPTLIYTPTSRPTLVPIASRTLVTLNTSVVLTGVTITTAVNSLTTLAAAPTIRPSRAPQYSPTKIPVTAKPTNTMRPSIAVTKRPTLSPSSCTTKSPTTLSSTTSSSLSKAVNSIGCGGACNVTISSTTQCLGGSRRQLSTTSATIFVEYKLTVLAEKLGYSSDSVAGVESYIQSHLDDGVATGTFVATANATAQSLGDNSLNYVAVVTPFSVATVQVDYLETLSPTTSPTAAPSMPTIAPTVGTETNVNFDSTITLTGLTVTVATSRRALTSLEETESLLSYVVFSLLGLAEGSSVSTVLVSDGAGNYDATFAISILVESLGYTADKANEAYTDSMNILTDSVTDGSFVAAVLAEVANRGFTDFTSFGTSGSFAFGAVTVVFVATRTPSISPTLTKTPTTTLSGEPTISPTAAPTSPPVMMGCPLTIHLYDTYGDGWNDAFLLATNSDYLEGSGISTNGTSFSEIEGYSPSGSSSSSVLSLLLRNSKMTILTVTNMRSVKDIQESWEILWTFDLNGKTYRGGVDTVMTLSCLWISPSEYYVKIVADSDTLNNKCDVCKKKIEVRAPSKSKINPPRITGNHQKPLPQTPKSSSRKPPITAAFSSFSSASTSSLLSVDLYSSDGSGWFDHSLPVSPYYSISNADRTRLVTRSSFCDQSREEKCEETLSDGQYVLRVGGGSSSSSSSGNTWKFCNVMGGVPSEVVFRWEDGQCTVLQASYGVTRLSPAAPDRVGKREEDSMLPLVFTVGGSVLSVSWGVAMLVAGAALTVVLGALGMKAYWSPHSDSVPPAAFQRNDMSTRSTSDLLAQSESERDGTI